MRDSLFTRRSATDCFAMRLFHREVRSASRLRRPSGSEGVRGREEARLCVCVRVRVRERKRGRVGGRQRIGSERSAIVSSVAAVALAWVCCVQKVSRLYLLCAGNCCCCYCCCDGKCEGAGEGKGKGKGKGEGEGRECNVR